MPVHDWSKVSDGEFHAFHGYLIHELARSLNRDYLPGNYYALPEQHGIGLIPDVLTLKTCPEFEEYAKDDSGGGVALAEPRLEVQCEMDNDFYSRKNRSVSVRRSDGRQLVAVIEVVSPGNKDSEEHLEAFLDKIAAFLDAGIHVLILDLLVPALDEPGGIHTTFWKRQSGKAPRYSESQPLSLASYEAGERVRAYVRSLAAGDTLPEMPLFLKVGKCVHLDLEPIYSTSVAALPRVILCELG